VPGVAGIGETVAVTVRGELLPQLLPAVTEMVPPAAPATSTMLLVVDVPVQPDGFVHV
jgi:hypothetical protein